MAGHAQLKFVMTEYSKTQIRLARLKYRWLIILTIYSIFFILFSPLCAENIIDLMSAGQWYFDVTLSYVDVVLKRNRTVIFVRLLKNQFCDLNGNKAY